MRKILIAAIAIAGPAMAQPNLPPAPPSYPVPQPPAPASQPGGLNGPVVAPGASGLYNVLNYGRNGARCTPSPLVPTACR
jgi:hypothetical protein